MRHLSVSEVIALHRQVIEQSGGSHGVRDLGALESALAQPRQTFGGAELHPNVQQKAAALGFSLIASHPFIDGNKRIGHAAMEVFLLLNGFEINAPVAEQERLILEIAQGNSSREALNEWLKLHIVKVRR